MRQREAKEPWALEEGTQLSPGSEEAAWKRQHKQGLGGVNQASCACLCTAQGLCETYITGHRAEHGGPW